MSVYVQTNKVDSWHSAEMIGFDFARHPDGKERRA